MIACVLLVLMLIFVFRLIGFVACDYLQLGFCLQIGFCAGVLFYLFGCLLAFDLLIWCLLITICGFVCCDVVCLAWFRCFTVYVFSCLRHGC